jgi:hypothetical protein
VILSEQEAEKLIQFLRGYLWHTTSIDGFRQISAQNSINVNRGDLQNAYTLSECSNCYEENAVSLFDFVTHRDRDLIGKRSSAPREMARSHVSPSADHFSGHGAWATCAASFVLSRTEAAAGLRWNHTKDRSVSRREYSLPIGAEDWRVAGRSAFEYFPLCRDQRCCHQPTVERIDLISLQKS